MGWLHGRRGEGGWNSGQNSDTKAGGVKTGEYGNTSAGLHFTNRKESFFLLHGTLLLIYFIMSCPLLCKHLLKCPGVGVTFYLFAVKITFLGPAR